MRSLPATINNCKGKIQGKCSLLSVLTSLMGLFTMLGNNTSWSGWARFINVRSSLLETRNIRLILKFERHYRRPMLTIRAMLGGEGYAQRHLRQSDYYDQNRTVEGQWLGSGAELLGLRGDVGSEDFEAVRQGFEPQTEEFLRQRHRADRIDSNGEEQSQARSLFDMTFSALKSVSIMATVGDERLIGAHETAVRDALEEAEKCLSHVSAG